MFPLPRELTTLPIRLGVGLPIPGLDILGLPKGGELVGTVPKEDDVEDLFLVV